MMPYLNHPSPLVAALAPLVSLLSHSQPASSTANPQSPYFKEILLGRCYARPPSGRPSDADSCLTDVGSLVSVLESRLDGDISTDLFGPYFDGADFGTPNDGAIFWPSRSGGTTPVVLGGDVATVERTPGGSLLDGLTFCGVDFRFECPEPSGAAMAFWGGAYAAFAAKAQGRVRAVISSKADIDTLRSWVAPNLNLLQLSSFEVYASEGMTCNSDAVIDLGDALMDNGISPTLVTCIDDPDLTRMALCSDSPDSPVCRCLEGGGEAYADTNIPPTPPSTAAENIATGDAAQGNDEKTSDKGGEGAIYAVLFWVLLFVVAGACFALWTRLNWKFSYQGVPEANPLPK